MSLLVFDTNVCGRLATIQNCTEIISILQSRHNVAASAVTIFELLLGLCRSSSEQHFRRDQFRFMIALGFVDCHQAQFLDHGLSFALSGTLGTETTETGEGERLFREYTELVLRARNLHELKSCVPWDGSTGRFLNCGVVESDFDNAKRFYRLDVERSLPDRASWAKGLAMVLGLDISTEQARRVADALDGLYHYEQWLRDAMARNFRPSKNANDRMDMHQLFYLADSTIEFITCEKNIRRRIEPSSQARRIVMLDELLEREGLGQE